MTNDKIYSKNFDPVPPFEFNKEVADVFDNMISRSVPMYYELEELISKFAIHYYKEDSHIYDLGCSTGETLIQISKRAKQNISLIGADSSEAMINKARQRCKKHSNIELTIADIRNIPLNNASVVILTYVLQFLPIKNRLKLIHNIYSNLLPNGVILLSEKVSFKQNNQDFIKLHEQFKESKNYSKLEIKQKREALENVLINKTQAENIQMLKDAGFKIIEPFFQYLNFCSFLAIK